MSFNFKRPHLSLKGLTKKQIIIRSLIATFVIILLIGVFIFFRINANVNKSFQGSTFSALTGNDPIEEDEGGSTNTLIFGNSSDDPGHGGALLADSIMVFSINNKTKKAYTVSIPRDLWINYDRKCSNGREGKINAYYQCIFRQNGRDDQAAGEAFAKKVGDILGIQIQYFAKANYTFVQDSVDALGGVDITIDSNDPRGILDRTFDTNCPNGPYTCYNVKYPNGPAHLDGQHALWLSRARNAKGGYGLPQSNFDREINQQLIVRAIQDKALSVGVLANPIKVVNLVDSLGDNITTNIPTSQLQAMRRALQSIKSSNIVSIPLNNTENPLVTTGTQSGQSIVLPTAGLHDYSVLQTTVRNTLAQ